MSGRRRGRRRAAQQAARVGDAVHLQRVTEGLSLSEAARRAGIARSTWERIEAGVASVTLANLAAATEAVGLDLVCQTYPGRPTSLRDSGQLAIAQALAAIADSSYRVTFEQRAGDHGEAIDLVLWGAAEVLAIEIERIAADWQGQYRRASMKRDWLAAQTDRPVRLVIVLADTRRNRTSLAPFELAIAQAFPAGTGAVLRSIRSGTRLGSDGLCWFRNRPA
jgi:transcriptional regulator with XRE-family HTH domain